MTFGGWLEIALYCVLLAALTPFLGGYLARVYAGELTFLGRIERPAYRLLGVDPQRGQEVLRRAPAVLARYSWDDTAARTLAQLERIAAR